MAILIPKKIENRMRRTPFTNNHEFFESLPAYMKEPNKDKEGRLLIWAFIKKHPSERDYIEEYWRRALKDQKEIKSKYR